MDDCPRDLGQITGRVVMRIGQVRLGRAHEKSVPGDGQHVVIAPGVSNRSDILRLQAQFGS
jgi:hypothetical protein